MLINLTVNASRVNMTAEDLLHYNGNPLVAPKGLIHTGIVNNLGNLISAYHATEANASKIRLGSLGNPPGAFMGFQSQNPTMYLTTGGTFVFSKHHQHVAVRTLGEHMEEIKKAYPEGADVRIVSKNDVGNTYINMSGGEVVTFEEKVGEAVPFKCDEADKWVVFNRLSGEWVEPVLHMAVDNHFRVETIDMVHVSVTGIDGADLHLTLDSGGFIHDVELMDEDGRANITAFELSDDNAIFKFLIPHGWEATTPVKAETDGNKNVAGPLMGGPLGASW